MIRFKLVFVLRGPNMVFKILSGAPEISLMDKNADGIELITPTRTFIPFFFIERFISSEPLISENRLDFDIPDTIYRFRKINFCSNDRDILMKRSRQMKASALLVMSLLQKGVEDQLILDEQDLVSRINSLPMDFVCHGDLNPKTNIFFDSKTKNIYIIDFDDCYLSSQHFDLLFLIFYSGSDLWDAMFQEVFKNPDDVEIDTEALKIIYYWFVVLKLSKIGVFNRNFRKKNIIEKRVKVIIDFKNMIERFMKYV